MLPLATQQSHNATATQPQGPNNSSVIPWPFQWVHAPKTGSHFAVSLYSAVCQDRLKGGMNQGFKKHMGSEFPMTSFNKKGQYVGNKKTEWCQSPTGQTVTFQTHDVRPLIVNF